LQTKHVEQNIHLKIPIVNFIVNARILRTKAFFLVTFLALNELSYEKCARKTLMKLTPTVGAKDCGLFDQNIDMIIFLHV